MHEELSLFELEDERIELLPARETLHFHANWASVVASNSSLALNAASLFSHASSTATQSIYVSQS
jgi:hypothetical protein